MKFTIRKSDIVEVLSKVQGITTRKSNLAITTCVLLRSTDQGIAITATDLETGFEGNYPAAVELEGSMAVNSKKFSEIVKEFPKEEILISQGENNWIKIGSQTVEFNLVGMNPEDFPDIPRFDDTVFFEMESAAFKKKLEKALIIAASDDRRAHVIGVYFEKIEKDDHQRVRLVSTDGSRLSTVDYRYGKEVALPEAAGFLIPKKGLAEMVKFLETEGNVKIGFKDNHFILKKDAEMVVIRLLEGEFPRYGDIIDRRHTHQISINRLDFLMMLKRMSILSTDHYKGVVFHFSQDKLVISSANPDLGESKEEMAIDFAGDPIEVVFNPRYFIDTIQMIDHEDIIINITNEELPCRVDSPSDPDYRTVIMPMRL
jgi:DNA polymerase-3 subunit beta